MDISDKVKRFCDAWQGISMVYEDYARSLGMSYTSLHILDTVYWNDGCTQKQISEKTLLPKQTINNIITAYYKNGYVELRELPENRRVKTMHLTTAGKEYAESVIPQIHHANIRAMEKLSEEEQDEMIRLTERYMSAFHAEMFGD